MPLIWCVLLKLNQIRYRSLVDFFVFFLFFSFLLGAAFAVYNRNRVSIIRTFCWISFVILYWTEKQANKRNKMFSDLAKYSHMRVKKIEKSDSGDSSNHNQPCCNGKNMYFFCLFFRMMAKTYAHTLFLWLLLLFIFIDENRCSIYPHWLAAHLLLYSKHKVK